MKKNVLHWIKLFSLTFICSGERMFGELSRRFVLSGPTCPFLDWLRLVLVQFMSERNAKNVNTVVVKGNRTLMSPYGWYHVLSRVDIKHTKENKGSITNQERACDSWPWHLSSIQLRCSNREGIDQFSMH